MATYGESSYDSIIPYIIGRVNINKWLVFKNVNKVQKLWCGLYKPILKVTVTCEAENAFLASASDIKADLFGINQLILVSLDTLQI